MLTKPRVIPVLLLQGKGLVKTTRFKNPTYLGDPINVVKILNDKEVDELVFLDIQASVKNTPLQFDLLSRISAECFMPFGYGGGIRKIEDIRTILRLGVEKVVINSYAAESPDFIQKAADLFGSQAIVVSIDVKKDIVGRYRVHTLGGRKNIGKPPEEYAGEMESVGAGEIILNSIDCDGTMQGYDLNLIKSVSEKVSIPVVACGGAGGMDDLVAAVHAGGASAAAAGSMFVFQGRHRAVLISYPSYKEQLDHFRINNTLQG